MTKQTRAPLLVIAGETASGKTALALELARSFNGEIIAADSRTVYKHMDIGTAKPTPRERAEIRHHLIDVVEPDQPFTAADYKPLAEAAINDVIKRGKLPIMVGGSGLYIDAVVYGYSFRPKPDERLRARYTAMTTDELKREVTLRGLKLPENSSNPRHLIRTLETNGATAHSGKLRPNTLLLGMKIDREILKQRVADRVEQMFSRGLEQEARYLVERYGADSQAAQTIGYREFLPYFSGQLNLSGVKEAIAHSTLLYAKRQRTWFRRNPDLNYICKSAEAVELLTTMLNK